MTYGELKAMVADYLCRDDLSSRIPSFIKLAIKKIETGGTYIVGGEKIDIKGYYDCMRERKTTETSDYLITLPSDFLAPIWLKVRDTAGEYRTLSMMTPEEVFDYYPNPSTDTGMPTQYGILKNQNEIIVRPSPDMTYIFDFMYYKTLGELSDNSDSNAWTENHWGLVLYGALLEAHMFLMSDQRVQLWFNMFSQELAALEKNNMRGQTSGGRLYVKPFYSI